MSGASPDGATLTQRDPLPLGRARRLLGPNDRKFVGGLSRSCCHGEMTRRSAAWSSARGQWRRSAFVYYGGGYRTVAAAPRALAVTTTTRASVRAECDREM